MAFNADEIKAQMNTVLEEVGKKKIELQEAEKKLKDLFEPLYSKKSEYNGKQIHVTLTKKGAVIINFVDSADAEEFYNKQ
jgi:hypothetical protein